MNVQWQNLRRTALRITKELEELQTRIAEMQQRETTTLDTADNGLWARTLVNRSSNLVRLRDRIAAAIVHMKDGTQ